MKGQTTLYDIIPDIHGQAGKLKHALTQLGYRDRGGSWRHSDPNRTCIFLGDFIDRGPDNAAVLDLVRRMIDAGNARAVMGNHELNAIQFHSRDPEQGRPLREHSPKNLDQHQSFLREFPLDSPQACDAIAWMRTLPLFLEYPGFRIVHACWDEVGIASLCDEVPDGTLNDEQLLRASCSDDPLCQLVETATKGPEALLPDGLRIRGKDGHERDTVRLRWWVRDAKTWAEMSISVPNDADLPKTPVPADIQDMAYSASAMPVLFGHYWMTGTPVLQAANVLCLDYSAGDEGPLVSCRMEDGQADLGLDWLTVHGKRKQLR